MLALGFTVIFSPSNDTHFHKTRRKKIAFALALACTGRQILGGESLRYKREHKGEAEREDTASRGRSCQHQEKGLAPVVPHPCLGGEKGRWGARIRRGKTEGADTERGKEVEG
jgi:hypothetical protein